IALDVSPYMLRKANEYLGYFPIYFERVISDMEKLPFRREVFDLVFGAAAIHHSTNLEKTIQELARVTKLHKRVITIRDHLRPAWLSLEEWKEGDRDTSFGVNENSFNYLDYKQAFLKSGLRSEIKVSKHYWSERSYAASVGQNAHVRLLVRFYHTLKFWLGDHAIVDVFSQKVSTRPYLWRWAAALLQVVNRQNLFVRIFQLLAPKSARYCEREKLFYLASIQAPSAQVDREMTYDVEVISNSVEDRQVKISFDIYPLANPRHPDRHVGYWAKVFTLKPGEKKHLRVNFNTRDLQAQFQLGDRYCPPDDVWRGDCFKGNRFYKVGFYLYDEHGNLIHEHVLLQRFSA
ncbi:MAG: class I SAM-dependent methyltransferase, partial [Chloroflexi bacterium]|nr:class I SAM-dependent methyltransferase [Chloroflexota bacterium]